MTDPDPDKRDDGEEDADDILAGFGRWSDERAERELPKRTIERKCLTCGTTLRISVFADGTYEGGHYFGEITVPDEQSDGDYEKTDEWEGFDVVRWTGERESFEYWECDPSTPHGCGWNS